MKSTIPKLLDFIGHSTIIVAHNVSFDFGFLAYNCFRLGYDVKKFIIAAIDTLYLSKKYLHGLKNYQLNTIANYLNISVDKSHRALDDAKAVAEIFLYFIKMQQNK